MARTASGAPICGLSDTVGANGGAVFAHNSLGVSPAPACEGWLEATMECGYVSARRVISSVVERFVHIEDVGSSNLSSPTNPCPMRGTRRPPP